MLQPEVSPASVKDIDKLLFIENKCFVAPWNKDNFLYELQENPVSCLLKLEYNGELIGFVDYWITFDSATIAQIAVLPEYRRNHFASLLMDDVISDCYAKKVIAITLEVRTHNTGAIAFYTKYGFKNVLTKQRYYTNGDDAFYMIKEVAN